MDPLFTVAMRRGVSAEGATVLVGTPGLGLVGVIASQYVSQHLGMTLVGGVHSVVMPPIATVDGGRPLPTIRLFFAHARRGRKMQRLVVVTGETAIEDEWAMHVADAIVTWGRKRRVACIVALDGIVVEDKQHDNAVFGVAALEKGIPMLVKQDVQALPDGVLGGMAGALLQSGMRHEVNTIALLAETTPGSPDAGAAARLVQVLDRMVPGMTIEADPLIQQSAEIEASIKQLREKLDAERRRGETGAMYG